MSKIKAIETFYKGFRFRSRLEARWAVFFDAMGVNWLYEPEGFELPNGMYYLPDFYLPDLGIWVEVKGSKTKEDEEKIFNFDNADKKGFEFSYRDIIMVGDIPPEVDDIVAWVYDTYMYKNSTYISGFIDFPYLPCVCPTCGKFGFEFDGRGARICRHDPLDDKGYSANHPKIKAAYRIARQARFEHGETPVVESVNDTVPKAAIEWYNKEVLNFDHEYDWNDVMARWEKRK